MAFSAPQRDFNKSRGIDPRAAATLDAKKNSRAKREDDLKRKQTEREINALRSRLSVVDREIQRLTVSERRYHGDEAKALEEFERESKEVLDLTNQLRNHSEKVTELQRALNTKKLLVSKSKNSHETADRENQRLKNELKEVDREIEQLNARKRRLISEMMTEQVKIKKTYDVDLKEEDKIFRELQSEEGLINGLKNRFSTAQQLMLRKQRELEQVRERVKGASGGSISLESEKEKLEKKISDLERNLN